MSVSLCSTLDSHSVSLPLLVIQTRVCVCVCVTVWGLHMPSEWAGLSVNVTCCRHDAYLFLVLVTVRHVVGSELQMLQILQPRRKMCITQIVGSDFVYSAEERMRLIFQTSFLSDFSCFSKFITLLHNVCIKNSRNVVVMRLCIVHAFSQSVFVWACHHYWSAGFCLWIDGILEDAAVRFCIWLRVARCCLFYQGGELLLMCY